MLTAGTQARGFAQGTAATPPPGNQSQPVQLEGELQILQQDFNDHRERVAYFLRLPNGTRVPLQFASQAPTHLLTGAQVRAAGQLSGGTLVLASGSTVLTSNTASPSTTTSSAATPPPNTFGAQNTLVILVNFQDAATQPYTISDAQTMFFSTASDFIKENSYGQTSLTGAVVGWYTIPDSITTCSLTQIATDAQKAATAAGANLSNYTRYVYAFPQNNACGFAGSSYIGGTPSQSWINGGLDLHTIDHELGHAFGLWHSHLLDCGTTATIGSTCAVTEYGDQLDTMGVPQTASPHYNAFQKERLGWLNYGASPSIQTVQASGTYTISPYELGGAGPIALKVLKSSNPTTGAKTWYYMEARQAMGSDIFLADASYYTQNETRGILFHIGTDGDGNTGDLLDMTPATPTYQGWYDPALATGQSFQDAAAGVTIAPISVSSTGATVQITMNEQACTAANPAVSVSPAQSQSVAAGTPVVFTVSVIDNDSSSCAAANFNLGDVLPSAWAGAWSTAALALSPGTSGTATLTVTSPAGTASGAYSVGFTATNASAASYAGSATAAYAITAPASSGVSVSANQSSYLPGQTVTLAVTVLSGSFPIVGASVTAAMTPPSGKPITLSGTTGSNGVALLSYRLPRRAATGIYRVQAATSAGGASASSGASTSFTVQ